MSKSLPIEYYPDPVPNDPQELTRYLDEELHRISAAMQAQPVAATVEQTETIAVSVVPDWQRLFDVGNAPTWEVPGGTFDTATGIWTCPQYGLYQHFVDMRIQAYGTGNKSYYAGIRLHRIPADGSPATFIEAVDSGVDDFELAVTLPVQAPAYIGDQFYCEGTVVHDQFVGTADIDASWQLNRVSGG